MATRQRAIFASCSSTTRSVRDINAPSEIATRGQRSGSSPLLERHSAAGSAETGWLSSRSGRVDRYTTTAGPPTQTAVRTPSRLGSASSSGLAGLLADSSRRLPGVEAARWPGRGGRASMETMAGFETAPADLKPLLSQRVSELGLKLEGSPVERYVADLYRELEAKGLKRFRPPTYLTDEWGCPDEEPIIGIPFYLADAKLARLEKELDDVEDAREIRMYLRHEAGHAFNYAYKLYETPEWRELFGPFNRPYPDRYKPVPFDRSFVRHMEGWYAQKHPDEDFAETFAVWLTPRARWRQRYRGWPAMRKLRYVDRTARRLGDTDPLVRLASTDITVEEMNMTEEEFFRAQDPAQVPVDVALEHDLPDFFVRRRQGARTAADFLREHRAVLVNRIEYWTGVRRSVIRALVTKIEETAARLGLAVPAAAEAATLVELTTYATTLVMNFLTHGRFIPHARRSGRGRRRHEGAAHHANHRRPRR